MLTIKQKTRYSVYETAFRSLEYGAGKFLSGVAYFLRGKPLDLSTTIEPHMISFPQDIYAHQNVQTEWWYYTGHCKTESGKRFGFELVFFKRQTDDDFLSFLPLRLLANPMYAAHFAITDIENKKFYFRDLKSFSCPLDIPASASTTALELSIGDWKISGCGDSHKLHASIGNDIIFRATVRSTKPPALNGHRSADQDAVRKERSSHFSYTRMQIDGTLSENGHSQSFSGSAWMDREFGTWYQRDWDWFSIQLEDDCELMIYQFRNKENKPSRLSHGTFIDRSGKCVYLDAKDFSIEILGTWKSARTGTEYPSGWNIRVEKLGTELKIIPYLEDQELDTRATTMIVYWEGACSVTGSRNDKKISGSAYAELVGYDGEDEKPTLIKFLKGFLKKQTR
ncbi:MAG: lipocalin family protein [Pyrinomonadaceae bacterium]